MPRAMGMYFCLLLLCATWGLHDAVLSPTSEGNGSEWSTSVHTIVRVPASPSNESVIAKLSQREASLNASSGERHYGRFREVRKDSVQCALPTWNQISRDLRFPISTAVVFHKQLFPTSTTPSPFTREFAPLSCEALLMCVPRTSLDLPLEGIKGVGRESTAAFWMPFLSLPIATALLLIVCTPSQSLHSKLDVQERVFVPLLGGMICAFFVGSYSTKFLKRTWVLLSTGIPLEQFLAHGAFDVIPLRDLLIYVSCSYALMMICLIVSFYYARVEFRWPCFHGSPYLQTIGVLRYVFYFFLQEYSLRLDCGCNRNHCSRIVRELSFWLVDGFLCYGLQPNIGALLDVYERSRRYWFNLYCWGDSTGICVLPYNSFGAPLGCLRVTSIILCTFAPYARDRFVIVAVFAFTAVSTRMGQMLLAYEINVYYRTKDLPVRLVVVPLVALAAIIAMRYERVLPSSLQKAKFIRLSYLYSMRREGRAITRCQDLPDSAFGNPAKAMVLVIISHRWLDRYRCDVATPSAPGGVRLTALCQRFENYFPRTWPALAAICGSPFGELTKATRSALYSSHDVLVFLDFMSLPQDGILPDGSIVERTDDEQLLFQEVLPHMGALYTMYPVLVSPEVIDGVPSYAASGWCFCEYEQAIIRDKLRQYSAEFLAQSKRYSIQSGGDESLGFLDKFEREVSEKVFYFEADREIVRRIVRGTHTNRKLYDAVIEQDAEKVQTLLKQLSDLGMNEAINYAIDDISLDTLLHVAVKLPSKSIVDILVHAGADRKQLNARGDSPAEFFMVPRSWLTCFKTYHHIE